MDADRVARERVSTGAPHGKGDSVGALAEKEGPGAPVGTPDDEDAIY